MKPELKLPATRPQPTDAELRLCELFSESKWAAKQAALLQPQIQAIVDRLGEVRCKAGTIRAATSVAYPMPTLAEWQGRVEALRDLIEINEAMPSQESAVTLSDLKARLTQMEDYTQRIREFHEVTAWVNEMNDYFKAAGIIIKQEKPTVKFFEVKEPPVRTKAPKPGKAAAETPTA